MNQFKLDLQLQHDCINLGKLNDIHLLIMNNSLVPWFIIVPETNETEICDLPKQQKQDVLKTIDDLSLLIKSNFEVDKLNIGAIGNIVNQLHIHIVGRRKDDYCWPHVVWGQKQKQPYESHEIQNILNKLNNEFNNSFKMNKNV